jgi:hypothetical protein
MIKIDLVLLRKCEKEKLEIFTAFDIFNNLPMLNIKFEAGAHRRKYKRNK